MSLSKISEEQRPRERLLRKGASALTVEELLAILLRTGPKGSDVLAMADSLLKEAGSLENLSRRSPAELLKFAGIGPAKACTLAAALELGVRLAEEGLKVGRHLNRPEDSGEYLVRIFRNQRQEAFGCIFLDRRNRILQYRVLSRGTRDASPVDQADLFRRALLIDASRLILFHNHPSGNPEASADDRAITRQIINGGTLLGLDVLDHLILAGPRWISLRDMWPDLFRR